MYKTSVSLSYILGLFEFFQDVCITVKYLDQHGSRHSPQMFLWNPVDIAASMPDIFGEIRATLLKCQTNCTLFFLPGKPKERKPWDPSKEWVDGTATSDNDCHHMLPLKCWSKHHFCIFLWILKPQPQPVMQTFIGWNPCTKHCRIVFRWNRRLHVFSVCLAASRLLFAPK